MLESIPYALAVAASSFLLWDYGKRRLAVTTAHLQVALEFGEMKRDYDLLKAQTKKAVSDIDASMRTAIEKTNTQLDEAIRRMQAQINIEDMKREQMLAGRRIG
jgi:hypothetical protein